MREPQEIKQLLNSVSAINDKYAEIMKVTGESFNIFSVLGVESSEVNLHSKMLTELLNPCGFHQQGKIFLDNFIDMLKEQLRINISFFPSDKTNVYPELNIGPISENGDEGGIIDIFLEDDQNNVIIIENKINGSDQEHQLLRYYNFGKKEKKAKNVYLLYLNLFSDEPDNSSITGPNHEKLKPREDFWTLNYSNHIKNWLMECRKESVEMPIIRETITQYINTIKLLTGQTRSDKMAQEITETLKGNIRSAFEISANIENLKDQLIDSELENGKSLKDQMKELADKLELQHIFDNDLRQAKGSCEPGFSFWKEEWNNFEIRFAFEHSNYQNFYWGIATKNKDEISDELLERIRTSLKPAGLDYNDQGSWDQGWPAYTYHSDFRYWKDDPTPWEMIANGEMKKDIEEKVDAIIKALQHIENEQLL